jgi:hypothetical protein
VTVNAVSAVAVTVFPSDVDVSTWELRSPTTFEQVDTDPLMSEQAG